MISRTCLLFLPILMLAQVLMPAQDKAPPEVDQELRARVNGFYHYFVVGSFSPRKAEAFIAEDTKEFFYDNGKIQFKEFRIDSISYSDNFTKASVMVIGKSMKMVRGTLVEMEQPMLTRWKIEDGKWCWTYDPQDVGRTPMGGARTDAPATAPAPGQMVIPKDPLSVLPKAPMGIDKSSVTLSASEPGSTQIVFTNGADGAVQVGLDGPTVRGLKATLEPATVPGHGTAVLTLKFDPADKSGPADVWEPKGRIPYRIVVNPFNRMYSLALTFTASK
jgi:hypothetical protein